MKRVILHIGAHKTGTSALQAFFAKGRDHMRRNGIAYPHPDPDSVVAAGGCSGNAVQILFAVDPAKQHVENASSMVTDAYFRMIRLVVDRQPEDTVLISSEFLGSLDASQVAMLKDALSGHSVEIVVFVRDPFDYAYSCWRQNVKDLSAVETFEDYIAAPELRMPLPSGFLDFSRAFGRMHVLRYERHKSNLLSAFFNAIGRPDAMPDLAQGTELIHNLSLSPSEALLCVALGNGLKSPDFSAFATRMLLARPVRRVDPFYSQGLHEKILNFFGGTIDEINRHLPSEDWLSKTVREPDGPEGGILPEDVAFVLELFRLSVLEKTPRGHKPDLKDSLSDLPEDFDADVYLTLNPDVAEARVDPVEHYLRHGRGEMRRYRIF